MLMAVAQDQLIENKVFVDNALIPSHPELLIQTLFLNLWFSREPDSCQSQLD